MNKYLFFIGIMLIILGNSSCNNSKNNQRTKHDNNLLDKDLEKANATIEPTGPLSDFLPKGYVTFDTIYGDLNKDGSDDCILIIKGTDKSKIVKDENRGELDRNRRGIIILFNKNGNYESVVKNYSCFSSENEDGGNYYAPELSVEVDKGNLYIRYAHGRYGYWSYTFRFQNSDFELIGYDASDNFGPVVNTEVSINYLTKKKLTKENTNTNAEGGDEVFKESMQKIEVQQLMKLSDIEDFDGLEVDGM
ncbi:hypothetical protein F0919_12610 [Taibaiella lutea]|uniref:Uncharacterized protein n=1 Tax=Taibaiella lutea TaxID=2608001 RepID=A0A5M6CDX8_9BACT|nr:hypothetical protein [Taibaiella lutea]KAA5533378.1 hypothetical protein F0919_12610 [Taibaiella lutea]